MTDSKGGQENIMHVLSVTFPIQNIFIRIDRAPAAANVKWKHSAYSSDDLAKALESAALYPLTPDMPQFSRHVSFNHSLCSYNS